MNRKEKKLKAMKERYLKLFEGIKFVHGYYLYYDEHFKIVDKVFIRNTKKELHIPTHFIRLLNEKSLKWNKIKVEFTIGYFNTKKSELFAIAIVHPKDHFVKRVGREYVAVRLKNALKMKRFPKTITWRRALERTWIDELREIKDKKEKEWLKEK